MSATETVLGTYELLEHILALLVPQAVPVADRVCKTWHQIVRRSRRIRTARCLKPIPFFTNFDEDLTLEGELAPYYENPGSFTISKLVRVAEESANGDGSSSRPSNNKWIIMLNFSEGTRSLRVSERAVHVTNPPVTAIKVDVLIPMDNDILSLRRPSCTVWNKEGVMIADLLDAVQALKATETTYSKIQVSSHDDDDNHYVYAGIRLGSSVRISDEKRSWRSITE